MAGAPAPKSLLLYSQRFSRQGLHGEALAGFLIPSDLLPGSAATAVVLDTNVVLAWWVFEDPRTRVLAQALQDHRLRWLATEPMLDELRHVLCRPLPHRWEASREHALTFEPRAWATTVAVPRQPPPHWQCSDPDDQKFLDLARALSAKWLLTRDRSLLRWRRRASAIGLRVAPPEDWEPG